MSYQNLRKKTEGFTIIEVLIVLAIAGLIMLIVFLAVPALQRNQRNTSRRDDVSKVLGAVQEVMSNNNGQISSVTNTNLTPVLGTGSYYDWTVAANLTVGAGAQTNATTTDTVSVRTGAACSDGNAVTGQARQVAVLYTVEPGTTRQCQSS